MLQAMQNTTENRSLAQKLTGRYGNLALTRAAGEYAAARRRGDQAQTTLWQNVVVDLRQTIAAEGR